MHHFQGVKIMKISNDILILKLVSSDGSIYSLTKRNLSHAQIAMLIQELIDKEFLIMEEDKLQVTDAGFNYLNDNLKRLNIKDKEAWILPQENYYTKPISFTDVILPKKI